MTTPSARYTVTPEQKSELRIRINDHIATRSQYTDATMQDYFAKWGRLVAMMEGAEPFEGLVRPNIVEEKYEAQPTDPLHRVKFFCKADDMRIGKAALRENLSLRFDPHAMQVPGEGNEHLRYFSVVDLPRESAMRCYHANTHIFTDIVFDQSTPEGRTQARPRLTKAQRMLQKARDRREATATTVLEAEPDDQPDDNIVDQNPHMVEQETVQEAHANGDEVDITLALLMEEEDDVREEHEVEQSVEASDGNEDTDLLEP